MNYYLDQINKENISNNLKCFKDEIIKLRKQMVKKLSPNEQHFNINDIAYICNNYALSEEVRITQIQDFSKIYNSDSGFIYYFYEYLDVNLFDRFKLYLKYYFWIIQSKIFNKNKPYMINGKFGPGHGELAGLGNVLFKTKEQAELDYIFDNLIFSINDFETEVLENIKTKKEN
jgi:hypothetical protein